MIRLQKYHLFLTTYEFVTFFRRPLRVKHSIVFGLSVIVVALLRSTIIIYKLFFYLLFCIGNSKNELYWFWIISLWLLRYPTSIHMQKKKAWIEFDFTWQFNAENYVLRLETILLFHRCTTIGNLNKKQTVTKNIFSLSLGVLIRCCCKSF